MTARSLNRPRLWQAGIFAFCALLAIPCSAEAQIGLGRGPSGRGTGIGLGGEDDKAEAQKNKDAALKKAGELVAAGEKLLEKGRIPEAKGKFKSAIELAGGEGPGQAAFDHLINLHKEGMARLEKAADLFEQKKFLEALQLARETKVLYANLFSGIPGTGNFPIVSQEAALLIKQIEANPEAKTAIQDYEALQKMPKVERLERKAKTSPAAYYDLYKALKNIVKHHPDCPTGKDCAKRLQALEDDAKTSKLIKKEGDRRFIEAALRRIDEYERSGESEKANAERRKLAERFPGKTLEELRRSAGKKG